jgi:hypothetical protein
MNLKSITGRMRGGEQLSIANCKPQRPEEIFGICIRNSFG